MEPTKPQPRLMTVRQAVDELGVSRWSVYRLVWDGRVQSVQLGRCRRIVWQCHLPLKIQCHQLLTVTTLADHRADRKESVTQALTAVRIDKPAHDTSRLIWRKLTSGNPRPPRARLLMPVIAERLAWRAEYDRAITRHRQCLGNSTSGLTTRGRTDT